jgi:periplasmic protein TonB
MIKQFFFFIIICLTSTAMMAQDHLSSDTIPNEEEQVYIIVEEMPEFRGGGIENFMKYVIQNIEFPVISEENGIQSRFIVQFVVGKDGFVKNVEMIRGMDPALDEEVIKVISSSPEWKPGKQKGKPVNVQFTMPVHIHLQ